MPRVKQHRKEILELAVQFGAGRRGVPHITRLRTWACAAYLAHIHAHRGAHVRASRNIPAAIVSMRIVSAVESRQLNREWRGKDNSTNVLSFPAGDVLSEDGAYNLGDLAICATVVAREAKAQLKASDAHWAHMIIHGVLHLLGYDHESQRDARVMEACEVATLARFGFPDPYE